MRTKLKVSNHTTKDGYKLVELYYYNQGKGVVLDTDVHVKEKFFDEAAVMKISSKVQTHVEDNAKLTEKEKRLKKIITEWQKRMVEDFGEDYGELYPPADYIKQTWKKPERDFANEEDVKDVLHKWIEGDPINGLVGKKSKVKEVSIYRQVLSDIKKLYKNRKLTFRDINQDFFQNLLTYWISKKPKIENSTINKRLTCLKIFLREEKKNKYNFYLSFKSGLSGISNQPVIIPTEVEFQQLVDAESALKVSQLPEEFDRARDYFVIGCSTSLRYGDIVRLTPANIMTINGHECIVTFIQKTNTPKHIIPLNAISKFFLEKQFKSNKWKIRTY